MLTDRRRRFVDAYLECMVAKDAAITAGYSVRTAKQIGSALLGKPEVAAEIAKRLEQITERSERAAADYLRRVDTIAFAQPNQVWSEGAILKATELGMRARKMLTDRLEATGVLGVSLDQLVPQRKPPATIDVPPAAAAEPAAELPAPPEPEPPRVAPEEPPLPAEKFAKTNFDPLAALRS